MNANATSGTSVADEWTKRLADVEGNDEVRQFVLIGGFAIDDHEFRTAVLGHHGETGGWPHHERRSDRNEEIALLRKLGGAHHLLFRHGLPKGDGRGLDRLVAMGAVGRPAMLVET